MSEVKCCETCYHLTCCERSKFCVWCGCWKSKAEFIRECARKDVLTGKDRDGLEKLANELSEKGR